MKKILILSELILCSICLGGPGTASNKSLTYNPSNYKVTNPTSTNWSTFCTANDIASKTTLTNLSNKLAWVSSYSSNIITIGSNKTFNWNTATFNGISSLSTTNLTSTNITNSNNINTNGLTTNSLNSTNITNSNNISTSSLTSTNITNSNNINTNGLTTNSLNSTNITNSDLLTTEYLIAGGPWLDNSGRDIPNIIYSKGFYFQSKIEKNNGNNTYSVTLGNTQFLYTDLVKKSVESTYDPSYTELSLAYAIGDKLSMKNNESIEYGITIVSIDGNKLTYSTTDDNAKSLRDNQATANNFTTKIDYSVKCVDKPLAGVVILSYSNSSFGSGNQVLGMSGVAGGRENKSFGDYSITLGRGNKAFYGGVSIGRYNLSNYMYTYLFGRSLTSGKSDQTVVGTFNEVSNDANFIVGSGTGNSIRKNSLEIASNDKVRILNQITVNPKTSNSIENDYQDTYVQNFRVAIDMSPTPADSIALVDSSGNILYSTVSLAEGDAMKGSSAKLVVSPNTVSYINTKPTGITTSSVSIGGSISSSLTNATDIVQSNSSTLPSEYSDTEFTLKTIGVSLDNNLSYIKTTGVTSVDNTQTTDQYMINMQYWTDFEMKVIDKYGNIVYYTRSYNIDTDDKSMVFHESMFDGRNTGDTIKFVVWSQDVTQHSSGTILPTTEWKTNGCFGIRFTHNGVDSIYSKVGDYRSVTKVWVYPSFGSTRSVGTNTIPIYTGPGEFTDCVSSSVTWGQYVRQVFMNPENTVVVWRQRNLGQEKYDQTKLWRPAPVEYYGKHSRFIELNIGGQCNETGN